MSNFNLFESCTFCQSRIGSTHCLLPFQFTHDYEPPVDEMSKIIDITEIHTTYGLHNLRNNFELIEWMKNRPTVEQIQKYSQDVRSRTSEWNLKTEIGVNQDYPPTVLYTESASQTDSSALSLDTNQEQGGTPLILKSEKVDELQEESSKTFADIVKEPKQAEAESEKTGLEAIGAKEAEFGQQKFPKPQSRRQSRMLELSRENENHLIQDLLMAVKTAYNLHTSQRGGMRIGQLCESLVYELNLKSTIGSGYKPTLNSQLDGTKALSREIVARHTDHDLTQWEKGSGRHESQLCLLTFGAFSIRATEFESFRLEESLIHYYNNFLVNKFVERGIRYEIGKAVQFELDRQNQASALDWINGRTRFLKYQLNSLTFRYEFEPIKSTDHRKGSDSLKEQPYPPCDQKLLDYISSHLQIFVNKSIEEAGTSVPTMEGGWKTTKFFFTLASEFLRRNKGWHNENSFTEPSHLTKVEQQTGLRIQPSEAYMTFKILKNIIDKFRKSFKERYQK